MQIIGTIEQILDKSDHIHTKKVAEINDDEGNTWFIEFRKNLFSAIEVLIPGDQVKVVFKNNGRLDSRKNHYNNVIAEKVERI